MCQVVVLSNVYGLVVVATVVLVIAEWLHPILVALGYHDVLVVATE
jgi:hypothetical protein